MSKTTKAEKISSKNRNYYSLHPWQCRHHQYHSEIVAYVEASGEWELVAAVRQTTGASPEELSEFICRIINEHQNNKNLLVAAMDALELCLEEANLTFSSEQVVDSIVDKMRKQGIK